MKKGGLSTCGCIRLNFRRSTAEDTVDACVIVMEIALDGEATVVGALAGAMKDVFNLEAGQIEPPPRIGTSLNTDFIRGMGKHDEELSLV